MRQRALPLLYPFDLPFRASFNAAAGFVASSTTPKFRRYDALAATRVLKTKFKQHLPLDDRNIMRRVGAIFFDLIHELHRIE